MFDYCVSRNKKGNSNKKESRVQCSIVEKKNDTAKCYPVIVLLYATALPCYYLTNVATWYGVTL